MSFLTRRKDFNVSPANIDYEYIHDRLHLAPQRSPRRETAAGDDKREHVPADDRVFDQARCFQHRERVVRGREFS